MNNPTLLYRSFAFSLLLHLILFIIALFTIGKGEIDRKTKTYEVILVEEYKAPATLSSTSSELQKKEIKSQQPPKETISKSNISKRIEQEKLVKERIEALEAKKKLEKIVALRKIIDIKERSSSLNKTYPIQNIRESQSMDSNTASALNDYYALIVNMIRRQWVYPEIFKGNLEAIVSIKILSDGSVKIDRVEKSSGNPLFDRYALRALSKASPLPPPPKELEVGIRFNP